MSDFTGYNQLPLMDEYQLQMLADDEDPSSAELLIELLELFEEDSKSLVNELKSTIERGNLSDASRIFHSLAGSGSNIGGKRLWGICKLLEGKSKEGDLEFPKEHLKEIEIILDDTLEGIRTEIKRIQGVE